MKIAVLTGAGISAESGLQTFRGNNGLWEGYNIYEVATPEAWNKNPTLVQEFYNMRRKNVLAAKPNAAHFALVELEKYHQVQIITQNVDDLHERAGSKNIIHLHGKISQSRSTLDPNLVYDIQGWELKMGDKCELGSQLRPHIVWFGEAVPMIDNAIELVKNVDLLLIIGTSLQVYPAAGLATEVDTNTKIIVVNTEKIHSFSTNANVQFIQGNATVEIPKIVEELKVL